MERDSPRNRRKLLSSNGSADQDASDLDEVDDQLRLNCVACNKAISGNCFFDSNNDCWHFECYRLRRQFDEQENESEEDSVSGLEDIQKIVTYWRNLYFRKSEECNFLVEEKDRIQAKLDEAKSSELVPVSQLELKSLKEKNLQLEARITDLMKDFLTVTEAHGQLMQRYKREKDEKESPTKIEKPSKEQDSFKQKNDELMQQLSLERFEKEQLIKKFEAQVQQLNKQISDLKVATPQSSEQDAEFKKLQLKVARVVQLYEEQKKYESQQLIELRQKYQELLDSKTEIKSISKDLKSPSIEGLSLMELQLKYEELKSRYENQLASIKGTSIDLTKKKLKKDEKEEENHIEDSERKTHEADVVREGPLQYRVVIGVDGKRVKLKEWSDSWTILNNQFLELYPNKESRFTKKRVKLDLSGASIEFDKDSRRKKDGHILYFTTETQGSYQLQFVSMEESEEWLKAIDQICKANSQTHLDLRNLSRRSHCIPHRFKEHYFTLTPTKCKLCNSVIHSRGLRCIHCAYPCHEKCSTQVPPDCGIDLTKAASLREKRTLRNSFSSFSLMRMGFGQTSEPSLGNEVFGVDLNHIPGSEDEVPTVVSLCITAIERRGGIETEGIYRIPGIKGEIDKLKMHFSYGRPNLDDEEWSDINVVGGVLKLWFRMLPDPLLTFEHFDSFLKAVEGSRPISEKVQAIKALTQKLPKRNLLILKYLISHLQKVAEKAQVNKMFAENLGAVFGPSLMRTPKEESLQYMGPQCTVVELMIANYQEIFC